MKADEFPLLLRGLTIPGASVRPADGAPGSGLQYGFIVTGQHGARMAWQVALQADGVKELDSSPVFPAAVATQPDKLVSADVEASIGAWIGQSAAAGHIGELTRYSADPKQTGIRYGLRVTLRTGERVFIQLLWTLAPDEKPGPGNKYVLLDAV